ncbi:MAG: beta-lactamase family protein [Deltaproteobacteria bacterium]|nr:beta-lactamase family protein [Deltaproteobacteria bacterium]
MHPVDVAMKQAVDSGVFPAAELLVCRGGAIVHHRHYGQSREGTLYDIASLTKVISTTTLAMQWIAEGRLKLTDRMADHLPELPHDTHGAITIEQILQHCAGYPRWQPYYQEVPIRAIGTPEGRRIILESALREPLVYPPGTNCIYSDIGYILLGELLERIGGNGLEHLFVERIAEPLDLLNTGYCPLPSSERMIPRPADYAIDRRYAPTEDCPWRRKVLHGEVHDQNCYAMGGVAGHAGLFSTAEDLHAFVHQFAACDRGHSEWIPSAVVRRFLRFSDRLPAADATWVLGWDTPAHPNSQAGRHFSRHSVGHLGYTGCSLWIDLENDCWVILLTNRIHPSTTNEKIRAFRPALHDLIYEELLSG